MAQAPALGGEKLLEVLLPDPGTPSQVVLPRARVRTLDRRSRPRWLWQGSQRLWRPVAPAVVGPKSATALISSRSGHHTMPSGTARAD